MGMSSVDRDVVLQTTRSLGSSRRFERVQQLVQPVDCRQVRHMSRPNVVASECVAVGPDDWLYNPVIHRFPKMLAYCSHLASSPTAPHKSTLPAREQEWLAVNVRH